MQLRLFPALVLLTLLQMVICQTESPLRFNRDLFGVHVSPYIMHDRPLNSYLVDEIKQMLRVIKPYFSRISTFTMGVDDSCLRQEQTSLPTSVHQVSNEKVSADWVSTRHLAVIDQNTGLGYPEGAVVMTAGEDDVPFRLVGPGTGVAASIRQIEKFQILPWDQCSSSALIPRAAAQLNREEGRPYFQVHIGVFNYRRIFKIDSDHVSSNQEADYWELQNALEATEEANRLFPSTVTGIVVTNEAFVYVTKESLESNLKAIMGAKKAGVSVGLRISCVEDLIEGDLNKMFQPVLLEIDFIYCRIIPVRSQGQFAVSAEDLATSVMSQFMALKSNIQDFNPKLEVMLGEVMWRKNMDLDDGANAQDLVKFWKSLDELGTQNGVKIYMAEAFDNPNAMDINKASGLWKFVDDKKNPSKINLQPKFT